MLEKKKNFWLLQTLNQVQGDDGIEVSEAFRRVVPEALEGRSLSLSKGANYGRVRLPSIFFVTSLLFVLRFVLFVTKLFLAVDGSRTNSRGCVWDWGIFLGRF